MSDRHTGASPQKLQEEERLFKDCLDAFNILSDPVKRQKYDEKTDPTKMRTDSFTATSPTSMNEEEKSSAKPATKPSTRRPSDRTSERPAAAPQPEADESYGTCVTSLLTPFVNCTF